MSAAASTPDGLWSPSITSSRTTSIGMLAKMARAFATAAVQATSSTSGLWRKNSWSPTCQSGSSSTNSTRVGSAGVTGTPLMTLPPMPLPPSPTVYPLLSHAIPLWEQQPHLDPFPLLAHQLGPAPVGLPHRPEASLHPTAMSA